MDVALDRRSPRPWLRWLNEGLFLRSLCTQYTPMSASIVWLLCLLQLCDELMRDVVLVIPTQTMAVHNRGRVPCLWCFAQVDNIVYSQSMRKSSRIFINFTRCFVVHWKLFEVWITSNKWKWLFEKVPKGAVFLVTRVSAADKKGNEHTEHEKMHSFGICGYERNVIHTPNTQVALW